MKQRVITFGCSYTQGVALPDCPNSTCPPSSFSWPSVVAENLGRECINNGVGGSGNLEILWNILKFDYQDDDIVIPMWSHFEREHVFTPDGHMRLHFHESADEQSKEFAEHWLTVHSEHDHMTRNWMYLHYADCFFRSKNLKYYHLFHANFEFERIKNHPDFLKIHNVIDLDFTAIDVGSDNGHPGVKSHKKFGDDVFILINENFTINI